MVDAAQEMLLRGDRHAAEELLSQVLRVEPTHERARQVMKAMGALTTPGRDQPLAPISMQTQPALPPAGDDRDEAATDTSRTSRVAPPKNVELPDDDVVTPFYTNVSSDSGPGRTPLEPQPAHEPAEPTLIRAPPSSPPGLQRRSTLQGTGNEMPAQKVGDVTLPAEARPPEERTDRHLTLVREEGTHSTEPQLPPVEGQREWKLTVLTGPHAGATLAIGRKPVVLGKGLGPLHLEDDFFISAAHASFFVRNDELWVSDGASASGTWLSLSQAEWVSPGGSFSAGLQRFRFLGLLEQGSSQVPWAYGAPRPQASYRLEHVLVGNRGGRVWLLRGVVSLGRLGVVSVPDDVTLEEQHVELRPARTSLEIVDKSSGGGVFVMLPPGGERRVPIGARVRLGATVFQAALR